MIFGLGVNKKKVRGVALSFCEETAQLINFSVTMPLYQMFLKCS